MRIIALVIVSLSMSAAGQLWPGNVNFLGNIHSAATGGGGSSDIPSTISGLTLRLKSSDLSIGAVSSWTDEISGRVFTNSTQPTNSATGVWFLSGHYLKQDTSSLGVYNSDGTKAVFVVYEAVNPSSYGSIFGGGSSEILMGYFTAPVGFGIGGGTTLKWVVSYPTSGVMTDVINAGGSSGNPQCYSNGVATVTFSTAGSAYDITYLGVNQAAHVDGFQGYLREVCVCDKGSTTLTSLQVSNLHYYATNT